VSGDWASQGQEQPQGHQALTGDLASWSLTSYDILFFFGENMAFLDVLENKHELHQSEMDIWKFNCLELEAYFQ
jgi:hypothetical protein